MAKVIRAENFPLILDSLLSFSCKTTMSAGSSACGYKTQMNYELATLLSKK